MGALISMVFIIPSIKFYKENPMYIDRFFNAPKEFTPDEKTIGERSRNVFLSFIQIPVGGMFRWQTGDSYNDFIDNNTFNYPLISKALTAIFIASLVWNIWFSVRHKDPKRAVIIAWALCPLWYLNILWTSDLVPRYFLISIPPIMILIALFFEDISKFHLSPLLIPVLISLYWIVFNVQYNNFIKTYSFPHGWFYDITETPYVYIKNAIDWVIADSQKNNCNPILSNDSNNPNFGLWMETEYPWKYVCKRNTEVDETADNCHYLIMHNDFPRTSVTYKQFGPFAAFRND